MGKGMIVELGRHRRSVGIAIAARLLAVAFSALLATSGTGRAQVGPLPGTDPEDEIVMPQTVEADLEEVYDPPPVVVDGPAPIFPELRFPGRQGFETWRDGFADRTGIRFSFSYQQLYQHANNTLPGSAFDSANGGWASFESIWSALNRGTDREGRLVLRLGWRGAIGNNAVPASFGAVNLGSAWSNFEFTSWDDHVRVEDLFWEQQLGPDFNFRIGNVIATSVYNFSRFKDARTSFTASPFAFQEVIPLPTFGFGASFRWTPSNRDPELYVVGTINDMNGDPAANGLDWSTVREGQFFYGVEIGKRWRRANGEFDHLHLDIFYADDRSTRNPTTSPNAPGGGFRVYGERQIGKVVAFGGYTYNEAEGGGISATFQRQVATAGLSYLNPFDVQGEASLGLMWAQPIVDIFPGSGRRNQYGFEAYWRMQVSPGFVVTPGLQVVYDPSFNPGEDVVVVPSIKFRAVF
jgi:hypothetical protein